MIDTHITRRRLIVAGTTVLTTGAAGLYAATDRAGAQASVTTDGLAIEDAEFRTDGPPQAVWAVISGGWEYRLETVPDIWEVYLLVYDDGGNSAAIGFTDGETTAMADSGTYALRGDVTAAGFHSPETFTVPDGDDSTTVTIDAEVALVLRNAAGDILAQDRAADSATVTVLPGGVMAQVGGEGEIVPQRVGEGTPALPEA